MEPVFSQEASLLAVSAQRLLNDIRKYDSSDEIASLYADFVSEIVSESSSSCVFATRLCAMQLQAEGHLEWSAADYKIQELRRIQEAYSSRIGDNLRKITNLRSENLFPLTESCEPWAEYAVFDIESERATEIEHVDCQKTEKLDVSGEVYVYQHLVAVQEMDLSGYLHSYALYTLARSFASSVLAFDFQTLWHDNVAKCTIARTKRCPKLAYLKGELMDFEEFREGDLLDFRLEVIEQMEAIYNVLEPEIPNSTSVGAKFKYLKELNGFILTYVDQAENQLLKQALCVYFKNNVYVTQYDVRLVIEQLESRLSLLLERVQAQKLSALQVCLEELLQDEEASQEQAEKMRECLMLQSDELNEVKTEIVHFKVETEESEKQLKQTIGWCFDELATGGRTSK